MNKLFPTQEIGSLAKPRWRVKGYRGKPLSKEEIAYLGTDGAVTLYVPLVSPAELYSEEPEESRKVNFRDYSILADSWLEDPVLWP